MKNQTQFPRYPATVFAVVMASTLLGCEAKPVKPTAAQVEALASKTKAQLIFVQGGEFQMGDFGEVHNAEKLPYTGEGHDGPLHKVTVTDFSIGKYKVTLGDYDIYASVHGLPLPYTGPKAEPSDITLREHPKSPTYPAGVDWPDAQGYCVWIGKQLGLAMSLPTEAEWEYAARGKGGYLVFATDNGKEEPGRNFATRDQIKKVTGIDYGDMPVGMYPPNPLGLYDLGHNGLEWTSDWYGSDYYATSPSQNPTGPAQGIKKVLRGMDGISAHPAMTFERQSREPELAKSPGSTTNIGMGFRCVARQPGLVKS